MKIRDWIIKKWITTDDCINHIRSIESLDEKHRVLTVAVKDMFNAVTADDILRQQPDGSWGYADKKLHREQAQMIAKQMEGFKKSELWKILKLDIRYQANKKMFVDSQSNTHHVFGKSLLWFIDIIETRLNK